MKVKANSCIHHDGAVFNEGDTIDMGEEAASALLAIGRVSPADAKAKALAAKLSNAVAEPEEPAASEEPAGA